MRSHAQLLMLSLLAALSVTATAQDQVVAIEAARILPISKEPIAGGVILIKGGKITAVGQDIAIPEGATVVDVGGGVAMPGLVDARAVRPVRGDLSNEQSDEITPTFRIRTAVDPRSKSLRHAVQRGITTLGVCPGSENVICGLGAVIKPTGKTVSEMLIKDEAALHITMGQESTSGNRIPRFIRPDSFRYRRPTTTMGVIWMLRKTLSDARQYAESHQQPDAALEVMSAALRNEIPVRVIARTAIDIRTSLRLAEEYGLKIIMDECTEGYRVPELLAAKRAPAVLGPFYYNPHTYSQYIEGRQCNWNNPGILAQAGVKVVLTSGADPEAADPLTAAIFAVRHGMAGDQALRAVTLTPAEVLGVADRVGSLDPGKDADILILSGDPLAATSRLQRVILSGRTIYQAEQ